jgi:hypothetical protein
MGLLPSLMCRCLHCHGAGIVTLVAMVLLLSMRRHLCSPGVFAIIVIMLLPSLRWHCCRCYVGVVTHVMMVLSPSLMCRSYCHCHNGVIAFVALAPLPTFHGHCCPCCASVVILIVLTSLPSHCMVVVTVAAPALLPPLSWRFCTIALVLLPLSHWHCCPWCAGISALVMQASLSLLCLRCAVDLQVSLPLLSWHVLSSG